MKTFTVFHDFQEKRRIREIRSDFGEAEIDLVQIAVGPSLQLVHAIPLSLFNAGCHHLDLPEPGVRVIVTLSAPHTDDRWYLVTEDAQGKRKLNLCRLYELEAT